MADDAQRKDPSDDSVIPSPMKEDAETTATRRELKQTSISEKEGAEPRPSSQGSSNASEADEAEKEDNDKAAEPEQRKAPDTKMSDVPAVPPPSDAKRNVASPKKKRAHDQLDEQKDNDDSLASSTELGDSSTLSRTDRSEPEKKRARDGDEASRPTSSGSGVTKPSDIKENESTTKEDKPKQTSASAFASSGFAKLASSSASPFGAVGGSGKNIFGGGSSSASPFGGFGAPAKPTEAPKLSFGGSGASTAAASPFGGLNGGQTSGFGSALGGGSAFSSLLSGGAKLTSFAKPGEGFKSDKPARPFGAPESDEEDGDKEDDEDGDEGSGDEAVGSDKESQEKKEKSEEPKESADDKKKPKLQKVVIDSGETGEVSLLQVRAKMFVMEKSAGAWKERGAGILKVNVPQSSVDYDEQGNPMPETFDASTLEDEGSKDGSKGRKSVRLILRQDHTLRVILNTVILPNMDFVLNTKLKSSTVLFMAFDGTEVMQVQMKLSEANANLFVNLMKVIQSALRDV